MAGEQETKILFDEMLKNLAHWCRILGIYSEFITGKSDTQLLEYARKNGLIFVTRDFPLYERCKRKGLQCILVKDEPLENQIAQVLKQSGATITFPEKTRCASCNGELEAVGKEALAGAVPQKTFETQTKFWKCRSCGKIFWEGSHWKNIGRIFGKIQLLLQEGKDSLD